MRSILKFPKPILFFSSCIAVLGVVIAVPSLARADATIGLGIQLSDTVIVGGTGSLGLSVENTADLGDADLNYSVSVSPLAGVAFGAVNPAPAALGPNESAFHIVTAMTSGITPLGGNTVTFTVEDPAATNSPQTLDATLFVLDHSDGRFISNGSTTLELDFGNVLLGSSSSLGYGIRNLAGEFRVGLDLDSISHMDPDAKFSTDAVPFSDLAAGAIRFFDVIVDTSMPGSFIAQYSFNLSDIDGLSGSIGGQTLTLNVLAKVVPEPSGLVLLVTGLASLWVGHRRRRA